MHLTLALAAARRSLAGDDDDTCTADLIAQHPHDTCSFVSDNCADTASGIVGSYVVFFHCVLGGSGVAFAPIAVVLLLVLLSGLGSTADVFFIPQLDFLAAMLQLPPDVAGVTLLALGNGAPDVFTAIAAAQALNFPLLLADLLGGSVFIATVVVGCVILVARTRAGGRVQLVDPFPFWRDMCFYVVCLLTVLLVSANGSIEVYEAAGFLGLYALYIATVISSSRLQAYLKRRRASRMSAGALNTSALMADGGEGGGAGEGRESAPAEAGGDDAEEKASPDPPLAGIDCEAPEGGGPARRALSMVLYVIELPLSFFRYLSIPAGDGHWDQRRRRWTVASVPLATFLFLVMCAGGDFPSAVAVGGRRAPAWAILATCAAALSVALWAGTGAACGTRERPRWFALLIFAGFVMTVVWLNLLANEVVALIEAIGLISGISTSILGLTVIAIGNSIGDLVADTAAARGSDVRMAVAACFGSPLLMNILGAGVSLTLNTAINGKPIDSPISKQCRVAYFFLFTALISSAIAFPLSNYSLPRAYAFYLIALYVLFLLVSCLVETKAIPESALCSWLPYQGHHCQPPHQS